MVQDQEQLEHMVQCLVYFYPKNWQINLLLLLEQEIKRWEEGQAAEEAQGKRKRELD